MTQNHLRTGSDLALQASTFSASNGLYMLFWLFLLGSIAGFFLEGLWSVLRWGKWTHHTGVVWGPFCTIYGLGAVAMYIAASLLTPARPMARWRVRIARFLICAVAGTLVEYFVSLFQEIGFGSVSWDYTHHRFNLGGRVSLKMTVVWGCAGLLFIEALCPAMQRLIAKISGHGGYIATWALIAFMCVDLAVSAAAVGRWRDRSAALPPRTSIGAALDKRFDDERMEALFPNMQFTSPGSYSYENHAA